MKTIKTIENEILRQCIASNFLHFSRHQKTAIIYFLELIATCIIFDQTNRKDVSKKFDYIQTVRKAFGIKENEQSPFYSHKNICFNRIDKTLNHLTLSEKKELVLLASGLIGCNGVPYYLEFIFCIRSFQQIGISPDEFYSIVMTNYKKKQTFFATN